VYDLKNEMLRALDLQTPAEFENVKRDEGRVRRAVFFAKTQLLVAIEITAPFSFEREAGKENENRSEGLVGGFFLADLPSIALTD
jgi:hypothetical protein